MARASRAKRRGGVFALVRKIGGENRVWWVKTLRWMAFLGFSGVLAAALGFYVLYQSIDIPDPNADFQTQTTKVYYSDGTTELGSFSTQDRENIGLDQVPASMQAAVIAAEDRSFYTNRGIDYRGIFRALRNNATTGSTQGASTITQQYVKILYLTQEQTYTRKVKEAILSMKVDNQLSKDEILEGYLNTVYYGNGAYGVEVAAKTYFGKSAKDLTVPESAFLATIINSPTYYDPYTEGAAERITTRYNYVLNGMLSTGAITSDEYAQFKDTLPAFAEKRVSSRFAGPNGHLLKMVQDHMAELQFTDGQLTGGGLRIVTTFDAPKQQAAIDAVEKVAPKGLDELHEAIVTVEPGTGAVRAMYGGPDFVTEGRNWARLGTQPGSTFKVFAVIAGLEDGFSLKTKLDGNAPFRIGRDVIENQGDAQGRSYGPIDLTKATASSVNTAFVDLTQQMSDGADISVGAEKIFAAAVEAGIPASVFEDVERVSSTSLGFAQVSPLYMANAYATIVAGGKQAEPYIIEKVTTAQGTEVHQHEVKTEQTISPDVAADTLAALQAVTTGDGSGVKARTICPTAGKTGTATGTQDDGSTGVSSSWFIGVTPKFATAVMYNRGDGNDDLEGYLKPFFGGTYPAQTFKAYMDTILKGTDCGTFPKAANIKGSKGTEYKKVTECPTPAEQPNAEGTACEPKPVPTCQPNEVVDPTTVTCVPAPEPTPTPTPTKTPTPTPTPTDPGTNPQSSQEACEEAGGTWNPGSLLNKCTLP